MIRSVDLQAGWPVIDAGNGTRQLPWAIAELVGLRGGSSAIDVEPRSIAIVRAQAAGGVLRCCVDACSTDIGVRPPADQTLNAVRSAPASSPGPVLNH